MRFANELRDDIPALKQLLVPTPRGIQIPLGELASFAIHPGPPMIRSENAQLTDWIYVDVDLSQRDLGGYMGLSRENTSRQLSVLRQRGIIAIEGATVLIRDRVGLEAAADADQE